MRKRDIAEGIRDGLLSDEIFVIEDGVKADSFTSLNQNLRAYRLPDHAKPRPSLAINDIKVLMARPFFVFHACGGSLGEPP